VIFKVVSVNEELSCDEWTEWNVEVVFNPSGKSIDVFDIETRDLTPITDIAELCQLRMRLDRVINDEVKRRSGG
jgi:hypothetical protein